MFFSPTVMPARKWRALSVLAVVYLAALSSLCAERPPAGGRGEKVIADIPYKSIGGRVLTLSLFLPASHGEGPDNRPVILFLNSGGWHSPGPGDGGIVRELGAVRRGYAVASVSHRSVQKEQVLCSAAVEDVREAAFFLRDHANEYGLDPNRFAVCGVSSGGHLALCLGTDPERPVRAVIDFFGPTDLARCFEVLQKIAPEGLRLLLGADPDKSPEQQSDEVRRLIAECSPLSRARQNAAPTLFFHGTDDPVVSIAQTALLYDEYRRLGVKSELFVGNGGTHDPATLAEKPVLEQTIFRFLEECGF